MGKFFALKAKAVYTEPTCAEDTAPLGSDRSAATGAGIPRGRAVSSARRSGQESWRESDKSRVREGRVLAVKEGFLPYDSGAVFVRQLRGPHLST